MNKGMSSKGDKYKPTNFWVEENKKISRADPKSFPRYQITHLKVKIKQKLFSYRVQNGECNFVGLYMVPLLKVPDVYKRQER